MTLTSYDETFVTDDDSLVEVPVALMQGLLLLLYRLNSEDVVTIQPGGDLAEQIEAAVSTLNVGLLERKIHPHQKLIDAGFYSHLITDV